MRACVLNSGSLGTEDRETYNIYRESDMEFKNTALIDVCAVNAITIYYISYY